MIDIRWQDYPATVDVVVRSTYRPNTADWRSELFRVRRSTEIAGRKRFVRLECELERTRTTPDDSDGARNALLTEPYDGAAAAPAWSQSAMNLTRCRHHSRCYRRLRRLLRISGRLLRAAGLRRHRTRPIDSGLVLSVRRWPASG